MNKITCPRCGTRIVGRRYPLEPLAKFMGVSVSAACHRLGVSGSTQKPARCHGITRNIADKAGAVLKEHPSVIWPEIIDHDIEDTSKVCADCGERFLGRRSDAKYCSERCRVRVAARRYAAKQRQDEAWRERQRQYMAAHYDECKSYRLRWQKAYYQRNREARIAYTREWRARREAS